MILLFVWGYLIFFVYDHWCAKAKLVYKVIGYWGLPFITRRIKKRKMLVVGGIIFFLIIHNVMSYIWFIEIVGMNNVPIKQIKECVYQSGLQPGVLKDEVNVKFIEKSITAQYS